MHNARRYFLVLLACFCVHPALAATTDSGLYRECIDEPVFEGRVCTVQANRDAKIGVILIHGLGGSTEDWKSTIPALAADFHVLTFDLSGFGKSDKGNKQYSPTHYAQLAQFLASHYFNDKPFHIVGHSMGGAIALRFASLRPANFQRLVLIDSAGILHPQVISKFLAGAMLERTSGVPQTRGFAERFSGKILEQVERLPILPADIVNSALGRDMVLQSSPERIAALELAGEDFSSAITAVSEPTLILWGDNDQIVPLRTGAVLAKRMPMGHLEIIVGSGHEPMLDQPDVLNSLVRKHLLSSATELAAQYKNLPTPSVLGSTRKGICSGKSGMDFSGDYLSIELRNCSNVTIRNARVGHLSVVNSRVVMTDSNIPGNEEGLFADNSDVTITNGDISGAVAIRSNNSRFDLAGVRLDGSRDAVKSVGSKFVFSVCNINSPHMHGTLHLYKKMADEVM